MAIKLLNSDKNKGGLVEKTVGDGEKWMSQSDSRGHFT